MTMTVGLGILVTVSATLAWALAYVLRQEIFGVIHPLTYGLMMAATCLAAFALLHGALGISLVPKDSEVPPQMLWLLGLALVLEALAVAGALYGIASTGAVFVAFVEIATPVLVMLFAWLIFARAEFNPTMLLGGAIMLAGCLVMIWGRLKL